MDGWEEQLGSILGDPQQMSRIADLARSLMGGGEPAGKPAGEPAQAPMPDLGKLASLLSGPAESGRDTRALLEAMKPWLSEKRRAKLDRAMKLGRMAKLAGFALGEGERRDV